MRPTEIRWIWLIRELLATGGSAWMRAVNFSYVIILSDCRFVFLAEFYATYAF
jgi:hypothetical protein